MAYAKKQVLVTDDRDWLTPQQAATRIGFHPESVRRMLRDGALQGFHIGSRWRIRPAILDELSRQGSVKPV